MFEIDFSPLFDFGVQVLALILFVLVSWAVQKLIKKLGLSVDAEVRTYLDEAIWRGIGYARTRLAGDKRKITLEVKDKVVADASNYVISKVPDALSHFKIDERALAEMVAARLGHYIPIEEDDEAEKNDTAADSN